MCDLLLSCSTEGGGDEIGSPAREERRGKFLFPAREERRENSSFSLNSSFLSFKG